MDDIHSISTVEISKFINIFRQSLLKEGYFEHSIYNSVPYKLENSISFQLPHNLFLRYGTEPEVWTIGNMYDKFFFVGSLFRNEPKLSRIHRYEFKIVDFYLQNGSMEDIVKIFLRLLSEAETALHLPGLSKVKVVYLSREEFDSRFDTSEESTSDETWRQESRGESTWLVVTHYPIEESFYDTPHGDATNKFEIMFQNPNETIEIASAGTVGSNLNKKNYIQNEDQLYDPKVFDKQFTGLGFGIERLIYLYRSNT